MKVRITFPNRATETWEVEENRWGGNPDLICSRGNEKCDLAFDTDADKNLFEANKNAKAVVVISGIFFNVIVKAFG